MSTFYINILQKKKLKKKWLILSNYDIDSNLYSCIRNKKTNNF